MQQRISPFLWFDTEAEDAARFYVSIFPNSRIVSVSHYTEANPSQAGTVMTVEFDLDGQRFIALNGGSQFKFSEAVSFAVACDTQEELDSYWELLAEGGEHGPCGWLKDRFGLSWQVVPSNMKELVAGPDREASRRAMTAMMGMSKLDIAALQAARDGLAPAP